MKQVGNIEIPQEAFLAVLSIDYLIVNRGFMSDKRLQLCRFAEEKEKRSKEARNCHGQTISWINNSGSNNSCYVY